MELIIDTNGTIPQLCLTHDPGTPPDDVAPACGWSLGASNLSVFVPLNATGNLTKRPHGSDKTGIEIRIVTVLFYMITFLFGIVGNTLVIYVIAKYDRIRSRSVSNYYIWNLAFADELFVLTIPFFCFGTFYNNWIFGEWTCKVAYVFRECNKYASLFTLMALSIDRFLATFHTMGKFRQVKVGIAVCTCIWLLCLIISMPYWLFSTIVKRRTTDSRMSCKVHWPRQEYHELWLYVQLFGGVVLPFAVIAVFNGLLVRRIHSRSSGVKHQSSSRTQHHNPIVSGGGSSGLVRQGTGSASVRQRQSLTSSMTRMMFVIVITFAICQLPLIVYEFVSFHIIRQLAQGRMTLTVDWMNRLIYCHMVAQTLMFISSCCNPIVYGISNRNYSKSSFAALAAGRQSIRFNRILFVDLYSAANS